MANKIVIQLEAASLAEAAMNMIDGTDTSLLMRILSDRLDAQGRVLMIHDKDVGEKAPPPSTEKKPSKRPIAVIKATQFKTAEKPTPVPAEQQDDFDDDDAQAVVEGADAPTEDATKLTITDVRASLDAFRTAHGLVTARTIMQEVGGSSKLVEIDASKYATLLAALAKHAQPTA